MAAGGGEADADGMIVGINVTPLVDVVLVLLIVFLLTAQLIETPVIAVDLPPAAHGSALASPGLTLHLTAAGALFVDGELLSREVLPARLTVRRAQEPDLQVTLMADAHLPHGQVVGLIDQLEAAGISRFGIGVAQAPADAAAAP